MADREKEKVSPEFIEKVTQLALEKLRLKLPVSSEQRVRKIHVGSDQADGKPIPPKVIFGDA